MGYWNRWQIWICNEHGKIGPVVHNKWPVSSQHLVSRPSKMLRDMVKPRRRNEKKTYLLHNNKKSRNACLHCKIYWSADFRSNLLSVICSFQIKLQKWKKAKTAPKLQYNRLLNDPNCKDMLTDSVKSKYNKLEWKFKVENIKSFCDIS